MFRWIQGTIWVTGSCILSCPLCVCISGGGAWWVCACTVGLISITVISGYATWSVFSQLLNENCTNNSYLLRFLTFKTKDNANEAKDTGDRIDCTFLEKEISKTAQTFHSHLVLPWYSHISPDEKYSLQIRSTMEDLLTGILKNIKQHINLSTLFKEILIIYMQYYRQFYRALRKVAQKAKKRPVDCVTHEEAILEAYKPIHSALKSKDGIQLHCRRLAHLLLINYLPSDITRSGLLFICIRDICAQNLLHAILGQLSNSQWLSETLAASLAKPERRAEEEKLPGIVPVSCPGEMSVLTKTCTSTQDPTSLKEDRVYSYTHSLSSIQEETSFDVIDIENSRIRARDSSSQATVPKNSDESILLSRSRVLPSSEHSESLRKYKQQPSLPFPTQEVLDSQCVGRSTAPFDFGQSPSIEKDSTDLPSRSVATALGDLISTTAGPLLPDPASFPNLSIKMWKSPLDEDPSTIPSEGRPLLQKNLFKRAIVEGMTEMDYKELHWKLSKGEEVEKEEEEKACEVSFKDLLLFPRQKESFRRESLDFSKDDQLMAAQGEIQRSKSLNNLPPSKIEVEFEKIVLCFSPKRSVSSEAIPRTSFSLDDICSRNLENSHETRMTWPKVKGALRKMKSFDRNDATADEFSLVEENQSVSSVIASISQPDNLIKVKSFQKDPKLMEASLSSSNSPSTSTLIVSPNSVTKLPSDCLSLELSSLEEEIRGSLGWDNPPDLSPIYEESENLASTIAKLRCLLSERQSQHSLGSQSSFGSSESEPKSAQSDPGRYSLEKATRFTFLQKDSFGSLGKEAVKSTSSRSDCCPPSATAEEDLMEAAEVPLDGKVFVSVSIPTTEVHSEATGFHYTMYLVQYDAIYMCEVMVPSPAEEPRGEGAPVATTPSAATQHKMMLQTNVVKRRFREFLSLHSALEDDPVMRAAMKGVKGPNKWLNLPFSKLDSATISSRRLFLEKYLQALIQRPQINSCGPLKDFLAYGCDSSISFGKKQLEINVPRLDKLLARKVSGVFHSLKTALPTFDSAETTVQSQVAHSGIAHIPITSSASESGALPSTSDKEPLIPAWAPTMLGDFHIRLDITAEEQACEMENALLAAITASSELCSPVEAALEVTGREFTSSKSSEPQESPFLSPYSVPILSKKDEAPSTCFSVFSNSSLPQETGENSEEGLCTPCVSSSVISRTNLPSTIQMPRHVNPLTSFWSEIGLSDVTALPRLRRDSQDSLGVGDGELEDGHPLFDVLVDLLVELVGSSENFMTRRGATVLMSRLFAKPFSSLLQSKFDELISEEFLSVAFDQIRDCMIQPPAAKSASSSYQAHLHHKTEDRPCGSDTSTKENLKITLSSFIPNALELVLGRETVQDSVTLFVESLQHPVLMRDLGLHLIDLAFVHLLLPV